MSWRLILLFSCRRRPWVKFSPDLHLHISFSQISRYFQGSSQVYIIVLYYYQVETFLFKTVWGRNVLLKCMRVERDAWPLPVSLMNVTYRDFALSLLHFSRPVGKIRPQIIPSLPLYSSVCLSVCLSVSLALSFLSFPPSLSLDLSFVQSCRTARK